MTVTPTVALRIKAARERKNLSQKDLARLIDVHPTTVSKWESDAQPVDLANLDKVARALGVQLEWLRKGDRTGDAARVSEENSREWSTTDRMKRLPFAARDRLHEYQRRMKKAGLPETDIDYFAEIVLDLTFSQYHVPSEGPLTENDWLAEVDDAWAAVEDYLRRKGVGV
jgi:transcriptional regulator with XRE-family HTH domain